MEIDNTRGFMGRVMNDRSIDTVLVAVAKPIERRLRATTRRRTGRRAGSTRIETGHRGARGDRRAVRITQTIYDGNDLADMLRAL